MPTIKNFIFCLDVSYNKGKNDIVGILPVMTPEYIPGLFSFAVCFTILGMDEGNHHLALAFKDSSEDVIALIDESEFLYEKDKGSNLPDEYLGVNIAINLQNVNIKHSGIYKMEVVLDSQCQGVFDIYVKGRNEKKYDECTL